MENLKRDLQINLLHVSMLQGNRPKIIGAIPYTQMSYAIQNGNVIITIKINRPADMCN
jgi:hypothetical protein